MLVKPRPHADDLDAHEEFRSSFARARAHGAAGDLEWRSRRSVSSPENKLNSMDVNEEALVDARAQTAPQMLFGGRD